MCVSVHVYQEVREGVMKGGMKLYVAPAIEVPVLCLVRPHYAYTYTLHKSESVSC